MSISRQSDGNSARPEKDLAGALVWAVLALALLVRLIDFDAPLTGPNSWRQADTASMARNFYVEDLSLFQPAIDWRGTGSGHIESEFPIFPWLVAGLYELLGVNEALGRMLSALFSVIGLWGLYRLVAELMDQKTGFWTMTLSAFMAPSIYYGRSFQPESMMLMSTTLGLFFAARFSRTGLWRYLVSSAVFISLAILNKITALYLGLPILYLFWLRWDGRVFLRREIYLYGLAVLVPVIAWYAHAHSLYLDSGLSFGIWGYGTDKWGNWDLVVSLSYWKRVIYSFVISRHLHFVGFGLFLVGFFLRRRTDSERFFDVWLGAGVIFLLVVGRGNFHHDYYQLPVLLPLCAFVAKVPSRFLQWPLWDRQRGSGWRYRAIVLTICLLVLGGLAIERYATYLNRAEQRALIQVPFAEIIASRVPMESLVVSVTGGDPTLLYLANRKGWIVRSVDEEVRQVGLLRDQGAVAIFGEYEALPTLAERRAVKRLGQRGDVVVLHDDDRYFLFRFASNPLRDSSL